MAAKSFKGNLEILNLSDIFQSLAMNRHSGTLIVNDGKREKKIFIAEGEITLLSSGRRMRLGDLLISVGKITNEDLDLALKLQKQSRKKLGEILVEEGFCEEEDINRILRMQIEEELYDLFLWRKAEFEFLAEQMPEDMARESPNLTRVSINTNSLIMEALRRLDEWSLIQDAVPSTKEVFTIVNAALVQGAEVPEALRRDPELIDGKTTVEGLAEKLFSSDFELCQHLAQLVKLGAIRALGQDELVDRAETSYALNDFPAAAALYSRLSEYHPGQPKIMIPLADSLRRTGAEKQALVIYEELAGQLELNRQDPERLRQCYEAILQLDPSRIDLTQKLEDLDLGMVTPGGAGRGVLPIVIVLLLLVGGGVGAFFKFGLKEDPVDTGPSPAADLLNKMKRAQAQQKYREWWEHGWKIWTEHRQAPEAKKVELPVVVTTTPAGYDIYVNDVYQKTTTLTEPRAVCTYVPATQLVIEAFAPEGREKGEKHLWEHTFPADAYTEPVPIAIYSKPDQSFISDGWLESGVVHAPPIDAYLAPSRNGTLRVLELTEHGLVPKDGWDRVITLGDPADIFSPPAVLDDQLYVGLTEGGVLALTLEAGPEGAAPAEPGEPRTNYPAPGQVVIQPLVVGDSAALAGGRLVLGTLTGDILAYPLAGGEPAWTHQVDGALAQRPLHWSGPVGAAQAGLCIFACADGSVRAFSVSDGKPFWTAYLDALVDGPPWELAGEIVVPLAGGRIIALDPARGEVRRVLYEDAGGEQISICAGEGLLFVANRKGELHALRDGRPAWKDPRPRPCAYLPRLALDGQRLLVAQDDEGMFGLDLATGEVAWQTKFSVGGRIVSPISVVGEKGFFVGTNKRYLYYFQREKTP